MLQKNIHLLTWKKGWNGCVQFVNYNIDVDGIINTHWYLLKTSYLILELNIYYLKLIINIY